MAKSTESEREVEQNWKIIYSFLEKRFEKKMITPVELNTIKEALENIKSKQRFVEENRALIKIRMKDSIYEKRSL